MTHININTKVFVIGSICWQLIKSSAMNVCLTQLSRLFPVASSFHLVIILPNFEKRDFLLHCVPQTLNQLGNHIKLNMLNLPQYTIPHAID